MTRVDAEKKAAEHKRRQPKLEFAAGVIPGKADWAVYQVKGNAKSIVEQ